MPGIQTAFAQGLAANRPAASSSNAGYYWLSTDTAGGTLYQSTGSAWVQLAPGVSAGGMSNPMTTTGDLIVGGSAGAPGRLGVGSSGQVLTVSGGTATWGAAGAGSGGALTQLARTVLSVAASTITFASISGSYNTLILDLVARSDRAAQDIENLYLRLNGDSAANYDWQRIYGNSSTASASEGIGASLIEIGFCPGATSPSGAAGQLHLILAEYAATTFHKAVHTDGVLRRNTGSGNMYRFAYGGLWRSTAAITSLVLGTENSSNFIAGTTATLWGAT